MTTTLLLLTANDPDQHLPLLTQEGKDLQRLLNAAPRKNYQVVLSPESDAEDLIKELNAPGRQIEVLHYAGHADGAQLRLRDGDASAEALANKLRTVGTVKLVFLNGCATRRQLRFFHAAGIPFVIATTRKVADERAFWVATQLYQYLTLGRTLQQAFAEVVADAGLQHKSVDLATRGLALGDGPEEEALLWGLYPRPGVEAEDYSLPFAAHSGPATTELNHTVFLNTLVYALEKTDTPAFAGIRRIAETQRRTPVLDKTKMGELTRALPLTLGGRIRQIMSKAEVEGEYYRELLYDYCILFETLLHHTVAMLTAQLWQHKTLAFAQQTPERENLAAFWQQNRLLRSPREYAAQVAGLLHWLQSANIAPPFSPTQLDQLSAYLRSTEFEAAADFFHRQKTQHHQRVRLQEAESLETCYYAQQHIGTCFRALHFVAGFAMASVRGINVVNFRHVPLVIDNMVSRLTLSEPEPTPVAGIRMLENKSVLSYQTDSGLLEDILDVVEPMSLFPFVIDRNVFTGKPNTEVDLYLFIGYFPDPQGQTCFHFCSVQNPEKIWAFDDHQDHVYLLHLGEEADETHKYNHLMANAGEFRGYLSDFKRRFVGATGGATHYNF